jgi:two-component system, OmpR family, sensor kinase
MISSLRWRLQFWHAIILSTVIAAFGTAFYFQLKRSTWGEIDLELLASARVLEGTLRTVPFRGRDDGPPARGPDHFGPPPPRPGDLRDGQPNRPYGERYQGPPRGGPRAPGGPSLPAGPGVPGGAPFPPDDRNESILRLPGMPPGQREGDLYFAVFTRDGNLLRSDSSEVDVQWTAIERPVEYRQVATRREVLLRGPNATLIVVGRDIRQQMDRLSAILLQLITAGVSVLSLGLVGGWWMSGRAIQPIAKISETASQINASNLSQRIDTSAMDEELRGLGTILNSMLVRLQDAFQQQSQFTADASHELRTPLAVLLSHCELALSRPRASEDYRQTIATCQKAGERMRGLVEDLLTLARADAGKLEIQTDLVELQLLVSDVAAMLETAAGNRQVTIRVMGDKVVCRGDADRLSQVIMNLTSNAIHYNKELGTVTITTVMDAEEAVIRVQDTGCGIPAAAIPHVFDRFYRVDEARSRQTGGSGLGLAICKSIIDAHRGQIIVQSKVDEGTVFEVRLPAVGGAKVDCVKVGVDEQ